MTFVPSAKVCGRGMVHPCTSLVATKVNRVSTSVSTAEAVACAGGMLEGGTVCFVDTQAARKTSKSPESAIEERMERGNINPSQPRAAALLPQSPAVNFHGRL